MKNSAKVKTLISIVLIMLGSMNLLANTRYTVSGQVKDNKTKEGLMFCNIAVYSLNDSLITGAASDINGFFNIMTEKGSYKFIVSYTGYSADTIKVSVKNEDLFVGIVKLNQAFNQLDEVTIVARTHENKIDREVQLVTKTMRVGTSNTTDVLGKLNGVALDRYSKTIKVDGSDKIILLVNGLEKDQDYIKNLSPDRLKEIEVIRNPSGRYALEGYSAVINVVLKSDYSGSEVFVSNNAFIDSDAENLEYMLPANTFLTTFNYTHDKINFYAKFQNDQNNLYLINNVEKQYGDQISINSEAENNEINQTILRNTNDYTIGADYIINPKHTISFESNLKSLPSATEVANQDYNVSLNDNGSLENYLANTNNEYEFQNFSNSLFYIYRINQNNKINADFSYSIYNANYTNTYLEELRYDRYEFGEDKKQSTKFNLEYEHTFNEKSSFSLGYGNNWKKVENSFNARTNNITEGTLFNDTSSYSSSETRHKIYAYYFQQLSKKLSLKVGIASEYSHPKFENLEKTYVIYQPYLDLKLDLHKYLNIKLKYRSNSDYPTIGQALPFTHVVDPYATETGNPKLEPGVENKLSLEIFALQGALTLEPYYNFSNNKIVRAIKLDNDGIYKYNYYNTEDFLKKGLKAGITIPLFKQSLIIQSNMDFYNSSITFEDKSHNLSDWNSNSMIAYISEKHSFVGALIYQKYLQGYIRAQGSVNTGIDFWMLFVQKGFFNDKLSINLGYVLPTNFGVEYKQTVTENTENYQKVDAIDISLAKNVLMFGISYRFNNGQKVRKNKKDVKFEVERESNRLF